MNDPNIELYCHVMEEVKRRVAVIYSFINGDSKIVSKAVLIESACLQIRKILELIALGSLVVNKAEFEKQNEKFKKLWNARLILNDIETINPFFYPQPVEFTPGDTAQFSGITDESIFLTKKKFLKVYEKCGKVMHADNPYGAKISYEYYENSVPVWLCEIMRLLEKHAVVFINHENIYLFEINSYPDGRVSGLTLAPYQDQTCPTK